MRLPRWKTPLPQYLGGGLAALALALMPGCTSMPVTSMAKLARTDFTTIDPSALRVAVKAPQSVKPRRGGVKLKLAVTLEGAKQQHEFVLGDLADPAELLSLRAEVSRGTAIHAFRLEPADVARVIAMRDEMLAAKQRGAKGSLTIGVSADGCRVGPLSDKVLLTTYLRTESDGEFFALARDVDLRNALSGEALDAKLPPC
uniref:Uncharacterized protein n=1 Tax=Rhodopseudomonas palustris (strain BisA53) TaxID=316055 RepID=Q07HC1_RHOP5